MSKEQILQLREPTEEEQALKAEIREEMVRDRCRLLRLQPFVGKLAMHLVMIPVIDRRLTTACTDGTHLYVDAEFYSRLDPEERLGIIGHEVWHCALRHFQRMDDRERNKFNYAADVEVDLLLRQDGFKIEMLPFDPDWIGKTAEQIYELMSDGLEQFQKDDQHLYPGDQPDDPDVQRGNPGENEQDEDKPEDEDGKGGNDDENDGRDGDEQWLRPDMPRVSHDDVIDSDYQPAFSEKLEDEWKNNLKSAIQQMRKKHGRRNGGREWGILPGNIKGLISDDGLEATVDWKRVLLDYVTEVFGGERQWLPPSRRHVWKKLYLPSRAKKKTIEIVLAIDTSASTTSDLPEFLAELRGMVNAFGEYKLTIIQCDYSIHAVNEYSNDDPLPEEGIGFHGCGGTSLIPPFQYVQEKIDREYMPPPTVFIYLTDGFGTVPEKAPDYPVIWCLTREGVKPAKWGIEVRIT